jgi:ABC-type oligopeptide transport system ATPase subunit
VNPKLLVLDEPVSALDASIQAQVLALLRELQVKHELSYLFISHDLDTVQALCHRVGIMRYGRIVEMGTVEQIFTNPLHPYTRLLLASMLAADPSDPRRNHLEREQALFAEPGLPVQEEQAADDEPTGELEAPSLVDTGQGHLVESSALANTSDLQTHRAANEHPVEEGGTGGGSSGP